MRGERLYGLTIKSHMLMLIHVLIAVVNVMADASHTNAQRGNAPPGARARSSPGGGGTLGPARGGNDRRIPRLRGGPACCSGTHRTWGASVASSR